MTTPNNGLQDCVRASVATFFNDLDGTEPANLYDMLVSAVEKPLLEVVMAQAQNNQSRAAQWLGLNRNTLRKKLVEHQLIERS
jgi:Fis family transcriptional regulator